MKRISEILEKMISSNPKLERLRLFSIVEAWRSVVGDVISEKAKVSDFKSGILIVRCSDPMWMNEVVLRKRKIIEKMNTILGKGFVKDIKVKR